MKFHFKIILFIVTISTPLFVERAVAKDCKKAVLAELPKIKEFAAKFLALQDPAAKIPQIPLQVDCNAQSFSSHYDPSYGANGIIRVGTKDQLNPSLMGATLAHEYFHAIFHTILLKDPKLIAIRNNRLKAISLYSENDQLMKKLTADEDPSFVRIKDLHFRYPKNKRLTRVFQNMVDSYNQENEKTLLRLSKINQELTPLRLAHIIPTGLDEFLSDLFAGAVYGNLEITEESLSSAPGYILKSRSFSVYRYPNTFRDYKGALGLPDVHQLFYPLRYLVGQAVRKDMEREDHWKAFNTAYNEIKNALAIYLQSTNNKSIAPEKIYEILSRVY